MRESHSASSVHEFVREDPDPGAADPAFVAQLQHEAKVANENCDRAMALAHKLSAELREAQSRINQFEHEADGLVDRSTFDQLRVEAETAVAKLQSDADARVARTKREADERIASVEAETENRIGRLQGELAQECDRVKIEADARIERISLEADERVARAEAEGNKRLDRVRAEVEDQFSRLKANLAQAEVRADRAEHWLVMIRRQIEEHLMPSFAAMHDRPPPPEAD
jgi:chromosome segregation ATPase